MGMGGGSTVSGHRLAILTIGRMLLGMLLHVVWRCMRFVFFKRLRAVRFGAVMIAGLSVIWGTGAGTLCSGT